MRWWHNISVYADKDELNIFETWSVPCASLALFAHLYLYCLLDPPASCTQILFIRHLWSQSREFLPKSLFICNDLSTVLSCFPAPWSSALYSKFLFISRRWFGLSGSDEFRLNFSFRCLSCRPLETKLQSQLKFYTLLMTLLDRRFRT